MKQGEKYKIKEGYATKVHHKDRKVIAKAGDEVLVIALHQDVIIVESVKKERFSIHKSYLQ
jgi:hypothetical protein